METDNIGIKTFFIIIIAIVFFEGVAIFLSHEKYLNPMLLLCIVRLIEITVITQVVLIWGKGLRSIGLAPPTIIKGIRKGLIWSVAFGLLTGFIFFIIYVSGMNPLKPVHTQLPLRKNELALFLIVGCIVAPIAEELFFRGILYGFFRRWGIPAALILTTVIFIFAHRNTGTILFTQAVGGIIFAVSYEMEKNLMVPIVIHILGNTAIFILSLVY